MYHNLKQHSQLVLAVKVEKENQRGYLFDRSDLNLKLKTTQLRFHFEQALIDPVNLAKLRL